MEKTNNIYGCKVPSLKELVLFLSNCDSPLGDLCNDMLSSTGNIHFDKPKEALIYLNNVISIRHPYTKDPIKALEKIYKLMTTE